MRFENERLLSKHIETYFVVKMNNIPVLDEWGLFISWGTVQKPYCWYCFEQDKEEKDNE
jgi:hypothetical protein